VGLRRGTGGSPQWECEASGLRGQVHRLDVGDRPFVDLEGEIYDVGWEFTLCLIWNRL